MGWQARVPNWIAIARAAEMTAIVATAPRRATDDFTPEASARRIRPRAARDRARDRFDRRTDRPGGVLLLYPVGRLDIDVDRRVDLDPGVPQLKSLAGVGEQRAVAPGGALRTRVAARYRCAFAPARRWLANLPFDLFHADGDLLGRARTCRRTFLCLPGHPELDHPRVRLFARQHQHVGLRVDSAAARSASRSSSR